MQKTVKHTAERGQRRAVLLAASMLPPGGLRRESFLSLCPLRETRALLNEGSLTVWNGKICLHPLLEGRLPAPNRGELQPFTLAILRRLGALHEEWEKKYRQVCSSCRRSQDKEVLCSSIRTAFEYLKAADVHTDLPVEDYLLQLRDTLHPSEEVLQNGYVLLVQLRRLLDRHMIAASRAAFADFHRQEGKALTQTLRTLLTLPDTDKALIKEGQFRLACYFHMVGDASERLVACRAYLQTECGQESGAKTLEIHRLALLSLAGIRKNKQLTWSEYLALKNGGNEE